MLLLGRFVLLLLLQSFEQLNKRAVAVVVDPIRSVKGKVVVDAFRLINPQLMMMGREPRQTTSNIGHLNKPSIQVINKGVLWLCRFAPGLNHSHCCPTLRYWFADT